MLKLLKGAKTWLLVAVAVMGAVLLKMAESAGRRKEREKRFSAEIETRDRMDEVPRIKDADANEEWFKGSDQ